MVNPRAKYTPSEKLECPPAAAAKLSLQLHSCSHDLPRSDPMSRSELGPPQRPDGPQHGGGETPVEQHRLEVPRVPDARDHGHGVHGPVEAQRARAEQHAEARRRQVEEGQPAGEPRGVPRHRVIRARELGRAAAAHAQAAQGDDRQAASDQC